MNSWISFIQSENYGRLRRRHFLYNGSFDVYSFPSIVPHQSNTYCVYDIEIKKNYSD